MATATEHADYEAFFTVTITCAIGAAETHRIDELKENLRTKLQDGIDELNLGLTDEFVVNDSIIIE